MTEFSTSVTRYEFWSRTTSDETRYMRVMNFVPTQNRERALEAGCGSGELALMLADQFELVVGIDLSPSMIKRAKMCQAETQKNNVDFLVGDLKNLPLTIGTFDFIVSEFVLHHTPLSCTLPALRRLLRPGGRMVLRNVVRVDSSWWYNSPGWFIWKAIRNIPQYTRKHGLWIMVRLIAFELSPSWFKHLRSNVHILPPEEFEEIHRQFLPGCEFDRWGDVITVRWEAPRIQPQENISERANRVVVNNTQVLTPRDNAPMMKRDMKEFSKEELERSIPERFERVVKWYPDRPAIKTGDDMLTYKKLDQASNRVAHTLLAQRGAETEPIALIFEHGSAPIVALFGVLKAGKGYIALDPSHPKSRLVSILEDAQAKLILTNTKNYEFAHTLAQNAYQLINIDELDSIFSDEKVDAPLSPDLLAAIFYTSGSTGQPKGVARDHRTILHSAWRNIHSYRIFADDRHSFLSFCGFSISVPDIFDTLLSGASLVPYSLRKTSLSHLIRWLQDEKVTIFCPAVSLFRQLLDLLSKEATGYFPQLRLIILAGQTVYGRDAELFKRCFSERTLLLSQFASTEAGLVTSFSTDRKTEIPWNVLPAGYAIEDKEIFLLDEAGQKVQQGDVGEIAVRSRYLSLGYWRKPELNQQKFLPDPEGGGKRIFLTGDLGRIHSNGCLEHLGRKDFLVKVRGNRVEMAEIEALLHNLAPVKEAVVIANQDESGENSLIAYWVPDTQPAILASELRMSLAERLPEYMLPSDFIALEQLPLTPNGKVDRLALSRPDWQRPSLDTLFVAPRNDLEYQLTEICEEILGVHPIGVTDNFFELGGNSLSFVRLLTEIEQITEKQIPPNALLGSPTIEKIVKMLHKLDQTSSALGAKNDSTPSQPYNPLKVLIQLFCLPHLPWSKKLTRAREIIQEIVIKHGPTCGKMILPYYLGNRFLIWFCGTSLVQSRVFHKEVRSFQALLPAIASPSKHEELIRHHLACNLWKFWRLHALTHGSSQQVDHWVHVKGQSSLQRAYDKGRGVIVLGSHFAQAQLTILVLTRLGFDDFQAIGKLAIHADVSQLRRARHMSGSKAARRSFLHLLSKFHEGQKRLKAGGMMLIAGDGGSGLRGVWLPFHGRRMEFKTGFAEAAVHTAATVIPVCVSLKPTGHLHVEFLDPLDSGTPEMSHEQRVAWLMQQYATLLEQRWLQEPENLEWGMIKRFLASPPLDI